MRFTLIMTGLGVLWCGLQLWLAYSKGIVWDRYRFIRREKNPAWFAFAVQSSWVAGSVVLLIFLATLFFGLAGP